MYSIDRISSTLQCTGGLSTKFAGRDIQEIREWRKRNTHIQHPALDHLLVRVNDRAENMEQGGSLSSTSPAHTRLGKWHGTEKT